MLNKLTKTPTFQDIATVHQAIAPFIHRTPVLQSESINRIAGATLFFKCENFQKIGAFKMRGACSAGLALTKEERVRGLATHSSGNHAQAVAMTAKQMNIPAYIVMPENSPEVKRKATAGYGAHITLCKPTLQAREQTLSEVVADTGATFIHPYNHYDVIAGQATCAKELIEEVDALDTIIAPIGGGGLMSGTAITTRHLLPQARIVGAEPKLVNDAYLSWKAGHIVKNTRTDTIADGLKTNLGEKTFAVIQQYVDDIITVSEAEIIAAMRLIWERMKIIIEPSCAVVLAIVLQQKEKFAGQRIGLIITGGNVDVGQLPF
ncbi:MAG: pyridoxal-phosphate dependent enzyme [Bacteroidota bacterium]